jgi:hypothetical protein
MKIESTAKASWVITTNNQSHTVTAIYDERGSYLTGTVAKVTYLLDGLVIEEKKASRVRAASYLSGELLVPIPNNSSKFVLSTQIESHITQETESVQFELTQDGVNIPCTENHYSIQPKMSLLGTIVLNLTVLAVIVALVVGFLNLVSSGNTEFIVSAILVCGGFLGLLIVITLISASPKRMSSEEKQAAGAATVGILAILGVIVAALAASKYDKDKKQQKQRTYVAPQRTQAQQTRQKELERQRAEQLAQKHQQDQQWKERQRLDELARQERERERLIQNIKAEDDRRREDNQQKYGGW